MTYSSTCQVLLLFLFHLSLYTLGWDIESLCCKFLYSLCFRVENNERFFYSRLHLPQKQKLKEIIGQIDDLQTY